MTLPFNPENPPAEPPPGCDRLVWTLAYRIHLDHQPDADGVCVARTCRMFWPCEGASLAEQAFLASVGAWAGLDLSRPETRWFANVPPPPRRGPAP